jgi:predicted flap endonuclease-1-like 5' DNA nuclease
LNLASDAIDDIPSREVLRELVNRMETAAAEAERGDSSGASEPSTPGANASSRRADDGVSALAITGGSGNGIAQLRERLLLEARRVSRARRKGLGDVIALASKGTFRFADLTKLTDADADKVEAALAELGRTAL